MLNLDKPSLNPAFVKSCFRDSSSSECYIPLPPETSLSNFSRRRHLKRFFILPENLRSRYATLTFKLKSDPTKIYMDACHLPSQWNPETSATQINHLLDRYYGSFRRGQKRVIRIYGPKTLGGRIRLFSEANKPSKNVQGPLSNTTEISKEREVADGNSVVSQASAAESGSALNKAAANKNREQTGNLSKPSSQHAEAMYNSWADKGDQGQPEAPPSVTLSAIAGRKGGVQAPSEAHSPNTSVHEFLEERYTKGFNWQSQGNLLNIPSVWALCEFTRLRSSSMLTPKISTASSASVVKKSFVVSQIRTTLFFSLYGLDDYAMALVYMDNYSAKLSSVQESLNVPANATVHTHVKMNYKSSELVIQIKNAENAPSEENAGSQAYQVRLALIGLKKKKRWHSRIVLAPNPVFNEEAVFKGITSDELAKMALRMRLYSCRKHRRNFIFAESTVSFTALNLRAGEADIPFALVSKVGHESVVDSESDIGDDTMSSSRFGSPISLHSRASRRSSTRTHRSGSRHQRPPSASSVASRKANTDVMPELETARRVAADRGANWPELLCGLAYNNTTKRLNISVLRANRLKIPEGSFRSPSYELYFSCISLSIIELRIQSRLYCKILDHLADNQFHNKLKRVIKVYVSLTLVSETGEEITSSHTHDVHLAANTEFGEKFAFDMNSLSPREVTLFVRVFQKHHIHKHESLGWFAIGAKNNGEEERSHWNEMLQAQGKEISRWHVLNENI
ncbi:hypothetical protein ACTXT7_001170 [Hymenolepis weldensis]